MKKLLVADFLARAAKEIPAEFRRVSLSACNYARVAIDHIGKPNKSEVNEARRKLGVEYKTLLVAAKLRDFGPAKVIGPFDLLNFLIR
jgi:hypothetical protein